MADHPLVRIGSLETWIRFALFTAILLLATSPVWPSDNGRCVSADIPWAVQLPHGAVHGPGHLRLCVRHAYSPVSHLHAVYVDGDPVGLVMSSSGLSEGSGEDHPVIVLHRNRSGPHRIVGFGWPHSGRTQTFLLRRFDGTGVRVDTTSPWIEPADDTVDGDTLTIAAVAR